MPCTTIAQQAVSEQTIAQCELNQYLATQSQTVTPTVDPLTHRDRRIIGEIIEVAPESIRTIWIEEGITVWVQLTDGGRLPFDKDWFATRVAEIKSTLPETPLERNERLSAELETACKKYGLTYSNIDWLSFSATLYRNNQRVGFIGCNLAGQWYSRQRQLGGNRMAVSAEAAIVQLGIEQAIAA